jgi:geranylgeranyl diphosphate/geranylgeranyl-bacteriochlorophyllide a reductase
MSTVEIADVAIIGAGPAGCWAAYQLARRGARVAIVDGSHPREKPCGGGVTGRALALVADAIDAARLPCCRIRSARFADSPRRRSVAVPLDDDALVVASRAEFDGMLLAAARRAGAALVPSRALDVTGNAGRFLIQTGAGPVAARLLIGADGTNSLVRRRLARPFARAELSIATGYFVHGATGDEILIELAADPPGYLWSFPRPGHLAVGICAQADQGATSGALRVRAERWIRQMELGRGARLEPYSWPIPSLTAAGFGSLTTSGPGWFLAGDAAGLVDPITREGIYFALRSGEWAAQAAASADRASHTRYSERIHDEIGADLARAARYKAGFFRPRFARLLIDALHESAGIRSVMADLVAGRHAYSTLKWSLAKTLEVGLAWRLITSA